MLRSIVVPAIGLFLVGAACSDDKPAVGLDDVEVASVRVLPDSPTVEVGTTRQLTALVRAADGTILDVRVDWSSLAESVAEVSAVGQLTGRTPGQATIVAQAVGRQGTSRVTVAPASGQRGLLPRSLTYLGGSGREQVRDVAVDAAGNVYVAGFTTSADFPTTPGAVQRNHNPGTPLTSAIATSDAFVMKYDPSGNLIWSTFVGGPNYDAAAALEVGPGGDVFIAGYAGPGFPVTNGAFQTAFQGGQEADFYGPQDGFVCRLRADGAAIVFCSYFGTPDRLGVRDVDVDANGNVYLASSYLAGTYPGSVGAAFINHPLGEQDAVLAKVSPDGSSVLWAVYVGGSGRDLGSNSVRLDAAGDPYLLFTTASPDAQVTAGAFDQSYNGRQDLFLAKFSAGTGALRWGTYLGGAGDEWTETHGLALDAAGNAYVGVPTTSANFPTTAGAYQSKLLGGGDVGVAKLSADGGRLLAGTLIGGSGADEGEGIAVDGDGAVFLSGTTGSSDFPTTAGAHQRTLGGGRDAVVVLLAPEFRSLQYSSYAGGSGEEIGRAVSTSANLNYIYGGQTVSRDLPVAAAVQVGYRGGETDGFFGRLLR
jgi:hypothetical protein